MNSSKKMSEDAQTLCDGFYSGELQQMTVNPRARNGFPYFRFDLHVHFHFNKETSTWDLLPQSVEVCTFIYLTEMAMRRSSRILNKLGFNRNPESPEFSEIPVGGGIILRLTGSGTDTTYWNIEESYLPPARVADPDDYSIDFPNVDGCLAMVCKDIEEVARNISHVIDPALHRLDSSFVSQAHMLEQGRNLIPIVRSEKRPAAKFKNWQGTDIADLLLWRNLGYNVGLLCEGLLVFDIDEGKGGTKPPWVPVQTPTSQSGNGKHYYFKLPDGMCVKNLSSVIAPHVDLKSGPTAYVVFPGSLHANGKSYKWLPGNSPADTPFHEVTPEMLEHLENFGAIKGPAVQGRGKTDRSANRTRPVQRRQAPTGPPSDEECAKAAELFDRLLRKVEFAEEGTRNDTLNRSAFTLGGLAATGALDENEVYDALFDAGIMSGLAEDETENTILSGFAAGKEQPLLLTEAREEKLEAIPDQPVPLLVDNLDPMRLAERMIKHQFRVDGYTTLVRFRGDWYQWDGRKYAQVLNEDMLSDTYHFLDRCRIQDKKGKVPKHVTAKKNLVQEVLTALIAQARNVTAEPPCWLGERTEPKPTDLVVFANTAVDVLNGTEVHISPEFFTLNSLPYSYLPEAKAPEWVEFLNSIWPYDPESIATLQELFGYYLTRNNSYHKIALLVGPKRAGKGVMQTVLEGLLGAANVGHPQFSAFAQNFGLQSLVGKQLAIVPDGRLSGRPDQAVIAERLLSISGGDVITVDRKYKDPADLRLGTRIMICSNEVPRLSDSTSALASRFLVLQLTKSFINKEDRTLASRLLKELPGIFNWSMVGCRRLRERGAFVQPKSGQEALDNLTKMSSPITAFASECLEFGDEFETSANQLYNHFLRWASRNGHRNTPTLQVFSRNFKDSNPQIVSTRPRGEDNKRSTVYRGVRLRDEDQHRSNPRHSCAV